MAACMTRRQHLRVRLLVRWCVLIENLNALERDLRDAIRVGAFEEEEGQHAEMILDRAWSELANGRPTFTTGN